jgi:hypothetical protein
VNYLRNPSFFELSFFLNNNQFVTKRINCFVFGLTHTLSNNSMKTPAFKKSKQTHQSFDDTDNDSITQNFQHLSDNPNLAETKEHECADFNDVSENKARKRSRCWGCINLFGKQPIYGQSPKLDLLWETYVENRDSMSDIQLAALISDVHMKQFVIPKIESSIGGELQEGDLWLPNDVLAHIQFHQIDVKLNIRSDIHD